MLEIYQLQQLIAIAENDTLSAAAESLYISHSTLSRTTQKLEEELGVKEKKMDALLRQNQGTQIIYHINQRTIPIPE